MCFQRNGREGLTLDLNCQLLCLGAVPSASLLAQIKTCFLYGRHSTNTGVGGQVRQTAEPEQQVLTDDCCCCCSRLNTQLVLTPGKSFGWFSRGSHRTATCTRSMIPWWPQQTVHWTPARRWRCRQEEGQHPQWKEERPLQVIPVQQHSIGHLH